MKCMCGKESEISKEEYPSIDFEFNGGLISFHPIFCSRECQIEGMEVLETMLKNIKHDIQTKDGDHLIEWLMKNKKESWNLRYYS